MTESHSISNLLFLVEADDFTSGCEKVSLFLEKSALVSYEQILFEKEHSLAATDDQFFQQLENGMELNRQTIRSFVDELKTMDFDKLDDLIDMKQGYESKILHTMVHLLDGFIGIDSSFYNMVEDSHQLSERVKKRITNAPENFWLIRIKAENPWSLI